MSKVFINSEPFDIFEARMILKKVCLPYKQKKFKQYGSIITLFDDNSANTAYDVRFTNDREYSIFKSNTQKFVVNGARCKALQTFNISFETIEEMKI